MQKLSHDFPDKQLGKAIPYGVYDLENNEAWVSVGIDHDTAEFAVASIAQWWKRMGRKRYGRAKRLLITGDSGGSNRLSEDLVSIFSDFVVRPQVSRGIRWAGRRAA